MTPHHQPGEIVAQRYRVLERRVQADSGVVYTATDLHTDQTVVLDPWLCGPEIDSRFRTQIEHEVAILSRMDHPAVASYLGCVPAKSKQGQFIYVVQQHMSGPSLAEMIQLGWHPDLAEIRHLAIHLLEGLIYLHNFAPPIIHRALNPHNLIWQEGGSVILSNFGIGRDLYNTATTETVLLQADGFIAPEQTQGQAFLASDLFGLGATLLFLLTRQNPAVFLRHNGKSRIRSYVREARDLGDWLVKLLAPAITDRFQFADEALAALDGNSILPLSDPQCPKTTPKQDLIPRTEQGQWMEFLALWLRSAGSHCCMGVLLIFVSLPSSIKAVRFAKVVQTMAPEVALFVQHCSPLVHRPNIHQRFQCSESTQ